jgi:hypothetical protein
MRKTREIMSTPDESDTTEKENVEVNEKEKKTKKEKDAVVDAHPDKDAPKRESGFCPLHSVVRPMLTTREAAFYLNRKEKTLIHWNHHDCGPVKPRKIRGRLGWPTDAVRAAVGVASLS